MTNPRKYPKYQHKATKLSERRTSKRELSIWEKCRQCADQMFNGERCMIHNPPLPNSPYISSTNGSETTTIWQELKFAFEDEINDWP